MLAVDHRNIVVASIEYNLNINSEICISIPCAASVSDANLNETDDILQQKL